MNFLVPKTTLEAVLQYLGAQPYVNVANLIGRLGQCQLDPRDIKKGEAELAAKKKEIEKKVVDIKKKVVKKVPKKNEKST